MSQIRQSARWFALSALVALGAAASPLEAQGRGRFDQAVRPLFEFKGRVDGEVRVAMRGREAWVQHGARGEDGWGNGRVNDRNNGRGYGTKNIVVLRPLPAEPGTVRVRLEHGGGRADVIQQPDRRNDYTTIIRVRDNGRDKDKAAYRVSAYWMDGDDRFDIGRGRDDDWDRPNRRDDDWWYDPRAGRTVLEWSGYVDDGLEIWIRDGRVIHRTLSGKGERDVRADLSPSGLPRDDAELRVIARSGRGDVVVVQQPSRRNDYTAVIRIRDPQPSYGYYDFTLTRSNRVVTRR